MRGTAAFRLDDPGLLRALGPIEPRELERRLRDRIELERLRTETEKDFVELKDAMAGLASHFEQSAPDDLDPDWLAEAAKRAQEKELEATAQFRPVIAALKDALQPPYNEFEAEAQQLLRDGIEVLEGWVAFYRRFSTMLAQQAAERRSPGDKVLHARPVKGEVDHEALSREFMARFPKIRAALAE
jgi:RNase P protein component